MRRVSKLAVSQIFTTMVSHFQFLEPVGDGEFSPTHTLFVYEGPDWCLHELQDSAGSAIRCWSYEILGLEQLEGVSRKREKQDAFRESTSVLC